MIIFHIGLLTICWWHNIWFE